MSVAALNEFLLVSGPGLLLLKLLTFDYNLSGTSLLDILSSLCYRLSRLWAQRAQFQQRAV